MPSSASTEGCITAGTNDIHSNMYAWIACAITCFSIFPCGKCLRVVRNVVRILRGEVPIAMEQEAAGGWVILCRHPSKCRHSGSYCSAQLIIRPATSLDRLEMVSVAQGAVYLHGREDTLRLRGAWVGASRCDPSFAAQGRLRISTDGGASL
jgi:hypothetical protein